MSYARESAPASDTSVPTSDVNMTDAPPAELTSVEEPTLEAPVLAPVSVQSAPASGQSDYGTRFASKQSAFTSETSKFKLASRELVEKSEAPPQLAHETAENNEEPIPTNKEPGTSNEENTLDNDVAEFIKKASRYVRNAQDKKLDHDAHTRNNKRLDALFLYAVKDLRKRTFAAIWNMVSDCNAAIRCFNKIGRKQIQRQILREAVVDYTKAGRGKGKQHYRLSGTQRNFAVLPDGHYCPHNDCRKNDIAYKTEASLKRHCRDVHHWPQ
ncbi:hypothetical protein C7974DRAFT_418154 [Boeremia exigua]|uniref:uncharacterized protein n=1 Tax=Boeremia exigua TaxID=749465 RepID=UPI001E8CF828|nr:uncharacterized protein C7974DRAFT_418154 [Boeremia exigua]KAH6613058.1 hypothetical protein C7974DRAFT_418154 [Boeremia exigua]